MNNMKDASALARSIVEVANLAGTKTSAIITDMNQVLGKNVGNALEIREILCVLQGKTCDIRLKEITYALGAELLVSCGRVKNEDEAFAMFEQALYSGKALEIFAKMCSALGVPTDFIENADKYLSHAAMVMPIFAPYSGYVSAMDTRKIGVSVIKMRGGRTVFGEKLDLSTGYMDFAQIGDFVDEKTPLCYVHCQDETQFNAVKNDILSAVKISDIAPKIADPIFSKIKSNMDE